MTKVKLFKTPTRTLSKPLVIKGVTDKVSLEKAATKLAGRVLGNLARASDMLDTSASREILDRAVGKVTQPVEHTGTFTLRAVHQELLVPVVKIEDDIVKRT